MIVLNYFNRIATTAPPPSPSLLPPPSPLGLVISCVGIQRPYGHHNTHTVSAVHECLVKGFAAIHEPMQVLCSVLQTEARSIIINIHVRRRRTTSPLYAPSLHHTHTHTEQY